MRLFLAATPDEDTRRAVADWARAAGGGLPDARWIPAESLHLTLRFLGEVAEADLDVLTRDVRTTARRHPALRAELGGPDTLPRRSRARVACMKLVPSESLSALRSDVARAAERALDLTPDPRLFKPHLTVARMRRPWKAAACARWRQRHCACRGLSFEITYVDLMESLLRPSGARYRTVERLPLGA